MKGHQFSDQEASTLEQILQHRRDVRGNQFLDKPIAKADLERILLAGTSAPSVGFSQPWEFVVVDDLATRQRIHAIFAEENRLAQAQFNGTRGDQYRTLKLEGILESALNLAVFYRPSSEPVLGQTSMSEVGRYSVVCAVQNMWLMARSLNIGMGWVSILSSAKVRDVLAAPTDRELIAYLCLGYAKEFYTNPELERLQWQKRKQLSDLVYWNRHSPEEKPS